jgi:hypothetical protein
MHTWLNMGMSTDAGAAQAPPHGFSDADRQRATQRPAEQVKAPPAMVPHGVQALPQLLGSSSAAQRLSLPQRWNLALQVMPHSPPVQVATPLLAPGQASRL